MIYNIIIPIIFDDNDFDDFNKKNWNAFVSNQDQYQAPNYCINL